MSDHSSLDPTNIAAMSVVVVVMTAALIHLIPTLFNAVWRILPGVAILMVIVGVLRGVLKKLL